MWGGYIDGGYGVLVLDGEVTVNTKHGQVTLQKGQGTMVYGSKAPNKAGPVAGSAREGRGRDH